MKGFVIYMGDFDIGARNTREEAEAMIREWGNDSLEIREEDLYHAVNEETGTILYTSSLAGAQDFAADIKKGSGWNCRVVPA